MIKNWDDVEDILFDGTDDEIKSLKCPVCKSNIFFEYNSNSNSLKYGCTNCGHIVRANGCHYSPNCIVSKKNYN